MADYCVQCSKDFDAPEGWSDFTHFFRKEGVLTVQLLPYPIKDICEGCGWTVINQQGKCVGVGRDMACPNGHFDKEFWDAQDQAVSYSYQQEEASELGVEE